MLQDESFEGWLALQGGTSTAAATQSSTADLHIIVKDAFTNTLGTRAWTAKGSGRRTQLGGRVALDAVDGRVQQQALRGHPGVGQQDLLQVDEYGRDVE